jgi:predicted metalloendopeptidase
MSKQRTLLSEDFYLHVNESWINDPKNAIPRKYPIHGSGLEAQIELVRQLKAKTDKNEEEMKISAIWEASEARFRSWESGTANYDPISRELEVLDAFLAPQKPIVDESDLATRLAEYFHYTHITGISNVFKFDKGPDLENSNNFVLDFSTSGLSLPSREYYTETNFAEKRDMYKQHLTNIRDMINGGSTVHLDDNFVQNVLDFEHKLASYLMKKEQARRSDECYTNVTLTDLYQKVNDLASVSGKQGNYPETERDFKMSPQQIQLMGAFLEKTYELFNLRDVLAANRERYFIKNNIANPPHPEHVTAYDGDAIRRVFAMVLNRDHFTKYRSYLQYKVIQAFGVYTTKELDDEAFDFFSRKLTGQKDQQPNDKQSIEFVNGYAGEMMGKVYVSKYFPESCKQDVRSSIEEVLRVMRESIKRNDWLTEPTKEKALVKLDKVSVKIGYPDVWKDYSDFDVKEGDSLYDISKKATKWALKVEFFDKINNVLDRTKWLMTPQTVGAYFMPTQNEIVFPAAILQPPFYCRSPDEIDFDYSDERMMIEELKPECKETGYDFTLAANLGGIGAVIAHEITHGYDDEGRKFDGDGNLNDWWTEDDAKLFTSKAAVMGEQAKEHKFDDPEDSKEYRMNPELTMGENLADLGGMSLALQTLTSRLRVSGASDEEIRVNQRVLFKSFANILKENANKDFLINQLTTDHHAPHHFRVNLVKNMDEFYTAFDIKETDKMYLPPAKRVRMW